MKPTQLSLDLTRTISSSIDEKTFHHHYHVLYDLPVDKDRVNYLEIGCYAGGSAILMLLRPNTRVVSIDIGRPISKSTVLDNVAKNNPLENFFEYIEGDSKSNETLNRARELMPEVDILFIDGAHDYESVKKDFENYQSLVVSGGYVVFDDYHDSEYSPEVKKAVDDIVKDLVNSEVVGNYEVIGTIENQLGARPESLKDGNCFIIRKL